MNRYLTSQERRLIIGLVLVLATGTIVRYHARQKVSGDNPPAPRHHPEP